MAGALLVVTTLVGCTFGGTGSTATPTSGPTGTPAATSTATPLAGLPTLSYKIVTQTAASVLQATPAVALPVSVGTNFQWSLAKDFRTLACTAKGTADPGGPSGHTVYQVFACQLATGAAAGTGTFIFTEVGSSTPQKVARVEVDSLGAQVASTPLLSYTITTTRFEGAAGLALAVYNGTNYQWDPGSNFQGLNCQPGGNADLGGPSGHPYFQAFACRLAAEKATGQGTLNFAAQHMNPPAPPTYTAQITLQLGQ